MNAAKVTLTSTVLAAALGLALGLSAAPTQAHCPHKGEIDGTHCAGDGGNVSNPDDFQDVACHKLFNLVDSFGAGLDGSCEKVGGGDCLFDVNVGVVIGNPVMKISLVENCTTDTMLVLPNFLDGPGGLNFPSFFDDCENDPDVNCPSSDTNTFLDGRDFVLTAVNGPDISPFSGNAVITNSTDHGEIVDITIAIAATSAGCGGSPASAINIDPGGKPAIHDLPVHTWILILGTKVMVTGPAPLCNAIVMKNDPLTARTMIVHDSIVEPLAYTDVGTLFSDLRMDDLGTNTNIGVGSSTIGRPAGDFGTAVQFDHVDRGLIDHNTIENEDDETGIDVVGTGVLVVNSEEFTIKNNTIKGGNVGIEVGPGADGLITKSTIIGDGLLGTVGIRCVGDPSVITIRKNNSVIDYDILIDC